MPTPDRSRAAALKFMDYLAQKGLMARATAQSRKAALGKVLSVLDDKEAEDVTQVDLEDAMSRFHNLQGQEYTPQSLQTYKSRAKAALDDFEAYLENPLGFRPSLNKRAPRSSIQKEAAPSRPTSPESHEHAPARPKFSEDFLNPTILPIPIRPDVTVRVQGLPFDLTKSEAEKIANVVKAMAMTE